MRTIKTYSTKVDADLAPGEQHCGERRHRDVSAGPQAKQDWAAQRSPQSRRAAPKQGHRIGICAACTYAAQQNG
jgi:hypothetical protein